MRLVMRCARQVVNVALANVHRRYSMSSNRLPYYVTKEDLSRYIEMVTAKFYPKSIMVSSSYCIQYPNPQLYMDLCQTYSISDVSCSIS